MTLLYERLLMHVVALMLIISLARSQEALELTPALVKQFAEKKVPYYFVRMESNNTDPGLSNVVDKNFWAPMAAMFPKYKFTRLRCSMYPTLCDEISVPDRVSQITSANHFLDFFIVAYAPRRPHTNYRLVELYRGVSEFTSVANRIQEVIMAKNPPKFEPDLPAEIEVSWERWQQKVPLPEKRHVKLAILVLTIDGFTLPNVWRAFLEGDEGEDIRVWVHDKNNSSSGEEIYVSHASRNVFNTPQVFTNRNTISLVRATLQLLRYADHFGGADYYVLVSGDSVPLLSVQELLERTSSTTTCESAPPNRLELHQQDKFKSLEQFRRKVFTNFYKSKNWFGLNNATAAWLVHPDNDFTDNFEIVSMADEYYWVNIVAHYRDKIGATWTRDPVMYDEWSVQQSIHPETLNVVNKSTASQGHWFARKITPQTRVSLPWYDDQAVGSKPKKPEGEL